MTTTINKSALICGHYFGLSGLKLSFIKDNQKSTLSLDPSATVEAFKQTGFIEDWTTEEGTGEPVILFSDSLEYLGYGFQQWYEFVKSFPISVELMYAVLENRLQNSECTAIPEAIPGALKHIKTLGKSAAIFLLMFLSSCGHIDANAPGRTELATAILFICLLSFAFHKDYKLRKL